MLRVNQYIMGDARHANESISHPYQPTACTDDEHYIRLIRHVFPINLIVLLYTIPSGPMNVPRVEKTKKKNASSTAACVSSSATWRRRLFHARPGSRSLHTRICRQEKRKCAEPWRIDTLLYIFSAMDGEIKNILPPPPFSGRLFTWSLPCLEIVSIRHHQPHLSRSDDAARSSSLFFRLHERSLLLCMCVHADSCRAERRRRPKGR